MNKSAQSPDYYHTYPIANAVRSQLNGTQTVRKNDIYEMYQITSAMRTQLNQTSLAGLDNLYLPTEQQSLNDIEKEMKIENQGGGER